MNGVMEIRVPGIKQYASLLLNKSMPPIKLHHCLDLFVITHTNSRMLVSGLQLKSYFTVRHREECAERAGRQGESPIPTRLSNENKNLKK